MNINFRQNIKNNHTASAPLPVVSFQGRKIAPETDRAIRQTYKTIISSLEIDTPLKIKHIAEKFGVDSEIALYTMKKLTTFANYSRIFEITHINYPQAEIPVVSLNSFIEYFSRKIKLPKIMFDFNDASKPCINTRKSLSDFFNEEKKVFNLCSTQIFNRAISNRKYLFADNAAISFLEKLKKDTPEAFKALTSDKNLKIVVLDGYNEGLTPFNQSVSLYKRTASIITRAKNLVKDKKHPEITDLKKAVDFAVNEKTIKRLKKLGITNFKIQKKRSFSPQNACREIAENLMPKFPQFSQFRNIFKQSFQRKDLREKLLQFLNDDAVVYSPKTLAKGLKNLQKDIEIACPCAPEKILYFVPDTTKSYGAVMHQFKTVNNIPDSQIIYELTDEHKGRFIVILDDMLISGMSTIARYDSAKIMQPGANIVMAHLLNDETGFRYALDHVKSFRINDKILKGPNTRFIIGKNFDTLFIPGYSGYTTNICFPYMAPDTNNEFFTNKIAPEFLH